MNVSQASSASALSRQHQNRDGLLCCSSILPASKDSFFVRMNQKRTNVLPKKPQITVITAMKKLCSFQMGVMEGFLPRRCVLCTQAAQRQPRVTQEGTLARQASQKEQERKQQGCCSRLMNPKPSALGSGEAKSFLEGTTQVMFPGWLCHPQPWDGIA